MLNTVEIVSKSIISGKQKNLLIFFKINIILYEGGLTFDGVLISKLSVLHFQVAHNLGARLSIAAFLN